MFKKLFVITVSLFIASSVFAADLSLDDIIAKIQSNQSKIHDMYAETTTTITSNMVMPGQESKGPQKMVQKAKMWTKGKDKSRIEMLSPTRQTTITYGDKMTIINPDTGQTITQDLSKMRAQSGMSGGSMDLSKALDYFDLSVDQKDNQYVIAGKPKQDNKFLGKMEFYIDADRWLPVKILMYDPKGKVMSRSEIEYAEFSGIWTPIRNVSDVNSPMGKMSIEMKYENVKINQGVKDSEFKI